VARLPGGTTAVLTDLKRWSRSATGRAAVLFAVVAGAYVVGAELAWHHHFSSGLAFGYPPSGVDVAVLLLVARRRWPVVIAAASHPASRSPATVRENHAGSAPPSVMT